jgi:hypothetical protein
MISSLSLVPRGIRLESESWSPLLINGFHLGTIVLSPNLGMRITIPSHHHPFIVIAILFFFFLNEKVILCTK